MAASGREGPGPLLATDGFRFASDSDAETYSQWQRRYFTEPLGSSSGELSDPDGDGFGNYSEWAFGTAPIDSQSKPEASAALVTLNPGDPARLVLVARLNPLATVDESSIASWLCLTPQISTGLSAWRNVQQHEVQLIVTPVRRMYILPASDGASSVFGRLRIHFVTEG